MASPPPPVGLPPPPRNVAQLKRTPLYLTFGTLSVLTVVVCYSIFNMGSSEKQQADKPAQQKTGAPVDAAELFKNAPNTAEIAARPRPRPHIQPVAAKPPITVTTEPPKASASAPPPPLPDDMTDAAIAMRRTAWAAYTQQLVDQQQKRLERQTNAMHADLGSSMDNQSAKGNAAPQGGGGSAPSATGQGQANGDFFSTHASNPATDYSPYTLTEPISPWEVKATDIVTAKLESALNSDRPGILRARVTKNVLDHATGTQILIPQGSILMGVYDTNIAYGQTSVTTAWTRIIYPAPCDQSLDLGAMPGADQTGSAGFEDLTDEHLGKIFTSALLVSIFGAGVQLSQPPGNAFQNNNPMQTAAGGIGQQLSQFGQQFASKGLSIPPTNRVRQGYDFTIMLTKDVAFAHPWREGVCEDNEATPE